MRRAGLLLLSLALCSCLRAGFRGSAADGPALDRGASDGGEQQQRFTLAVAIHTGANIDPASVMTIMVDHAPFEVKDAPSIVGLPPEVMSILNGEAVAWSQPLRSEEKDAWASFPESVQLTFVISENGTLLVSAASARRDDVLSVLTSGGIDGYDTATFGHPFSTSQQLTHPLLGLDARATQLAELGYRVYKQLAQSNGVSDGPEVVCSSYGCDDDQVIPGFDQLPFQIYNGMGDDIAVLQSAVYASQSDTIWACGCPYDGIAFADGPWAPLEEALNRAWNPKASDTTDGPASRSFALAYGEVQASYLSTYADGDNSNSGSVALDNKVVSEFSGWDALSHFYRQPGLMPALVSLELDNSWSRSTAVFRMAILGECPAFQNMAEAPTGGLDGNPAPQTWVIRPGWNS